MNSKRCPKCNLHNPATAQRCDCGYDFEAGEVKSTYMSEKQQGQTKKKISLFGKLEAKSDAEKTAKDCAYGFYAIAAIQTALSFFLSFSVLLDAALYTICGFFILKKHSRFAAVFSLLLAVGGLFVTFANITGANLGGGNNIFLALIVAWVAIRAVEATFKLHGKYKENEPANSP